MKSDSVIDVDYRALVSRADLVYLSPAEESIEGTPIGNGRMGTNVWTTPRSVRFQINRNDLFSSDRNHAGSHGCPVDYRGACGRVEIDFIDHVFADREAFRQHLSLYDAECVIDGTGVRVSCFISSSSDLLLLEVDDGRAKPENLRITLSMWRPEEVTTPLYLWNGKALGHEEVDTGRHTVRYSYSEFDGGVVVNQCFEETRRFRDEGYLASSAVAVKVSGGDTTIESPGGGGSWQPVALTWDEHPLHMTYERARVDGGARQGRSIIIPARRGPRMILVSSCAATTQQSEGGGNTAMAVIDAVAGRSYVELRREHATWWHDYWSRTFVHLSSEDGVAEFMERARALHLYHAAISSRGDGPVPLATGLLCQTEGDIPQLGTQLWHWIVESTYRPLIAADALDVAEPYFDMYARQLPSCERAAQQRWGVPGGAFFPETSPTDGPTLLPEEEAREFREYFLGRSAADSLSLSTLVLSQHDSHLHHISRYPTGETSSRPWCSIGHIVSTGSKIALQAWWRYRCSGDVDFLRDRAYPLLRGTVELYRHLVKRGDDGLFHLEGTNVMESFYLVKDSLKDLAAIRGTMPPAIRAAEILGVDVELREQWREIVDNLAPYPMGHEPESKALNRGTLADDVWAAGHLGEINQDNGRYPFEDIWAHPIETFETWTLETDDAREDAIVQGLIDLCPNHLEVMTGRQWRPSLVRTPIAYAMAGRGEQLPAVLAAHYAVYAPHLANGLSLFEQGIQSMGLEHSGVATMTLQCGLMQSISPHPGEPEIIRVFPAWPQAWDASFRLLARGGFLVTSTIRNGAVEFVEIESRLGEECRLRNPWGRACQIVGDSAPSAAAGEILRFATEAGSQYRIVPENASKLKTRSVSPEPASGPAAYSYTLPSGVTVGCRIGRGREEPAKDLAPFVTGNRRMRIEQARLEDQVARKAASGR